MRIRRKRGPEKMVDPLEELIEVLKATTPPGGRLVITAWVSPGRVSEESRERLHNHLIEAHGAMGVLSIGLGSPEATGHA